MGACGCGKSAPSASGLVPFDSLTVASGGHVALTPSQLEECNLAATEDAPVDGEGDLQKNKIENVSISFQCDGTINEQLKLTPGSDPVDHWGWNPSAAFSLDPATGKLSGSVDVSSPKEYNITFSAYRADGSVIDERPYRIVAESCGEGAIKFIHPLPGSVCTSKCSANRQHPVTGQVRAHKGCDFAFGGGKVDKVIAAADGKVVYAGSMSGYGNIVAIEHSLNGQPACYSKYAHLDSIYVSVGQKVSAGTPLGMEGNTGIGTGKHLHFEIRVGSGTSASAQVIDPLSVINGTFSVSTDGTPNSSAPQTNTNKAIGEKKAAQTNSPCPTVGTDPAPTPAAQTPAAADPSDCFENCFNYTMKHEVGPAYNPTAADCIDGSSATKCGLVNNPADPGGLTKFGVSKRANPDVDISGLTLAGARTVYKTRYWTPCKADSFNSCKKKLLMVDAMYLGGLKMVGAIVQKMTGKSFGADAIAAINAMDDAAFSSQYKTARDEYIRSLKNYPKFGRGWDRRTAELAGTSIA